MVNWITNTKHNGMTSLKITTSLSDLRNGGWTCRQIIMLQLTTLCLKTLKRKYKTLAEFSALGSGGMLSA